MSEEQKGIRLYGGTERRGAVSLNVNSVLTAVAIAMILGVGTMVLSMSRDIVGIQTSLQFVLQDKLDNQARFTAFDLRLRAIEFSNGGKSTP